MNNLKNNQSGNFVLSLLVSCGIIALLSMIAIPYLKKYQPNLRLDAMARLLASDLRLAQQLSVNEQISHNVVFDLENDSYNIIKSDDVETVIKSVGFDSDVSFQSIIGLTNNKVIFNYYGSVSEAGQIVLININGITSQINIKPSGYTQVAQ